MNRREFIAKSGLALSSIIGLRAAGTQNKSEGFDVKNARNRKPNLLLIMADQHRGDCLGCDGNKIIKTPHIDALAADGVCFKAGYSTTPSCTPARAGLLTGLSPWHHGMIGYAEVAEHYKFEMPQMLRDAGYYTFGIGKMHYHPQRALHGFHGTMLEEGRREDVPGFVSDYRKWFAKEAPGQDPDKSGLGYNGYRADIFPFEERLHPTAWTGATACDFIEKYDRPEPFMLKVSFLRPHSPYDPPKRFWDMYTADEMPSAKVGNWAAKYAPRSGKDDTIWHGDIGPEQPKLARKGYYGNVSFIDEQVGKLIEALRKKDLYDNTLIIYTADHGDMLGDHHLWRKTYAYEPSARIPFLLKWHANLKCKKGQTLDNPVELRDVLPTFLDAAGLSVPSEMDGKSLLGLMNNHNADWRKYIDLEHAICYKGSHNWTALTDGKFKYIFDAHDGKEQLFDLQKDPGECVDLSAETAHAQTLELWRQRMVEHLAERGPEYVKDGKLQIRRKKTLYSPNYPA